MSSLSGSLIDSTLRRTNSTSLANVPIGTASSDRVVFVNITGTAILVDGLFTFVNPANATIGGLSANFVNDGTGIPGHGWLWANVAIGTTATIIIPNYTNGFVVDGVWITTGDSTAALISAQGNGSGSEPSVSLPPFILAAGDVLIGQAYVTASSAPTIAFTAGLTPPTRS